MNELSVALSMTPELSAELDKRRGILAFVQEAYPVIEGPEVANEAAAELKTLKGHAKWIEESEDKFVAPAQQIIANARSFFGPAKIAVKAAIDHLNTGLLSWTEAEKKRVELERREREEAERRARAKADAEAAAIRAKAEQEAREAARKSAEAEAARKQAEAEGRSKEAAKFAAEAAKRAEEEKALLEAAQAKAEAVQSEAAAAVAPQPEASKVIGFSSRKNFKARLKAGETEQSAILKIVEALPKRPELIAFLTLDMTALHKQAKALELNFNVPGLEAKNMAVGVST